MFELRTPNPGESSPSVLVRHAVSQSIGRGRISWEGALDVRESRDRRDKIFAEKQKTPKFWIRNSSFQWRFFIFLAAEKLTLGGGIASQVNKWLASEQ